jgi:putative PEP-CTERM system histidine kinase
MNIFATLSYGCAAVAFLMLTVLLLTSWRGRRQGAFVIVACAATAAWAAVLAASNYFGSMPGSAIYYAEIGRSLAWLLALVSIAGPAAPLWLRRTVLVIGVVLLLGPFIAPYFIWLGLLPDDSTLLLARSGLLLALLGLVLLEQIYRNSGPADRQALKYVVFGTGVLLAYDVFLYSQAELLRGITLDAWSVRGILNACAVPLLAISARRNPSWSLEVFVSRQMVFYSSTFIAVGAYLTVMSLGGFYVRQVGGEWGRVGQIVFMAGSLVLLVSLTASATLRRQTRVFISKHFYRNKYDYRVEWLRFIGTLSLEQDADVRHTAIRAVAQIFASPAAILLTLDDTGRRFVPAAAWPMRLDSVPGLQEVAADSELASFLARTHWIVDMPELRQTPDMYGNMTLPDWIDGNRELRIVSPLLKLDRLVGFVLLYQPPAPFELTYEDRDLLKTVGRHIATYIAQYEADRRLAESAQFAAYNRLTAFLMHDLKNSVAQLKLIVTNASRHKHNPEFIEDSIDTIANAVERMTRLIEQLRSDPSRMRQASVRLDELVRHAATRCSDRQPAPVVVATAAATVRADPERLTAIVEHLIRNAQDASAASGSISIEVSVAEQTALLTVADTGSGMDPEFVRERLFRPFDSTKGSKGMGIGAYQVREYVRMLGGQVEVQSNPQKGTRFSITLPLLGPAAVRPGAPGEVGQLSGQPAEQVDL